MRLVRVRSLRVARMVAAGVLRYNHASVSPIRVLRRPHFTIHQGSKIGGWIGYESRGRGSYELVHLSVKPAFRNGGMAQRAVSQVMYMVCQAGGRYAYTRINSRNYPSICLAKKMGMRKVRGGSVCIYGTQLR